MNDERKNYMVHVWPLVKTNEVGNREWKAVLEVYSEVLSDWIYIDVDLSLGNKPEDYVDTGGKVQCIGGDEVETNLPEVPLPTVPELKEDDPDPWPLLPERSEAQRRNDGMAVNEVLYDMNKDNFIDSKTGDDTLKQFSYHEIEPLRKIRRKNDSV